MALQSEIDPAFDARWAAWLARGAARNRRMHHRLAIVAPIVAAAAVAIALLLIR